MEPEKITGNLNKESSPEEVIEVRPPIQPSMARPSADTPLVRMTPTVAASLKQTMANLPNPEENGDDVAIKEGESCKNNGCKEFYGGENLECKFHPGVPVFHEVNNDNLASTEISFYFLGYEVLVLLPEENY